jgi:hypothetical protein
MRKRLNARRGKAWRANTFAAGRGGSRPQGSSSQARPKPNLRAYAGDPFGKTGGRFGVILTFKDDAVDDGNAEIPVTPDGLANGSIRPQRPFADCVGSCFPLS